MDNDKAEVLDGLRSPMEVTVYGNLAAYLRMLAMEEDEIRGVNKIALDGIVDSIVDRVKAERGYASKEEAEAWPFDGCCDTGMNTWFPDDK
ncbi:MAG: hypothetical protein O7C75_07515 [Verrucomicrobia bacterium]|nr:hypothetical protein [Verrucomicrobiota bacterium]